MTAGRATSADLVRAYAARIVALDRDGPQLHAVNPNAVADAMALDVERRAKGARGPLHGIPILIKDNIETADPMPTTAGSLALSGNITDRDAPLVARFRAAGYSIVSVLARRGQAQALMERAEALDAPLQSGANGVTALGIGPGRWLFIGASLARLAPLADLASLSRVL
jgi:hypothetical protein